MADCGGECYQIVTEITSYNIDNQRSDCPGNWEREIADYVAAWIRAHGRTVTDYGCGECLCVPWAERQAPIPLAPRNVTTRLQWVGTGAAPGGGRCIYVAVVTYQIKESKVPIGWCRPKQPFAFVRSSLEASMDVGSPMEPASGRGVARASKARSKKSGARG